MGIFAFLIVTDFFLAALRFVKEFVMLVIGRSSVVMGSMVENTIFEFQLDLIFIVIKKMQGILAFYRLVQIDDFLIELIFTVHNRLIYKKIQSSDLNLFFF